MINGHGDDIYNYKNIRLNFSSNIYGHFNHDGLYRHLNGQCHRVMNYPEPSSTRLEEALAEDMGVKKSQVMVTNGATEAIYLIAQTHCGSSTFIVEPTFSEYTDACLIHNHKVSHVFDLPNHLFGVTLVWLCCPNNPTGTVVSKEELVRCITSNPHTLFVIDASYAPFTNKPLITPSWATRKSNVLMIHSMTKRFAIPGLRVGYITGNADLLKSIRLQQMPWSVNSLAQEAGIYLLNHQDEYIIYTDELIKEKDRMTHELESTGIVDVQPSDSHILLCKLRKGKSSELKEHLATNYGILIRDASNFQGLSKSHFRIAVQGHEEDDELLEAIKTWKT